MQNKVSVTLKWGALARVALIPTLLLAALCLSSTSASAALLAFDDFSTYNQDVTIVGQTGTPTGSPGFEAGSWAGGASTVSGGVVTRSGTNNRVYRSFNGTLATTGTVWIWADLAMGASFSALEFSPVENSNADRFALVGRGTLQIDVTDSTGGGTVSADTGVTNDNGSHLWLVSLDLDAGTGKAWIDPNTSSFDPNVGGTSFDYAAVTDADASKFALGAVNLARFGSSASVALDELRIGQTLTDVGVTTAPKGTVIMVR